MATEIRVPTLGESVTEATVGKWFKRAGDAIAADEPIVELETDKVTVEVPAPAAGTLADPGAVVRRCGNPSCGRYFVDRTPAGTRHFCSELTCGQGRWADRRRGVLT